MAPFLSKCFGPAHYMRDMEIRPFKARRKINDLGSLIERRLRAGVITTPEQAVPLLGYMAWPNDETARIHWREAHDVGDESAIRPLLVKFKTIQQHWAKTADIVHLLYDLDSGRHQEPVVERVSARQLPSLAPMQRAKVHNRLIFGECGRSIRTLLTWSPQQCSFLLEHKPGTDKSHMA
jgi:hypothetical protein